jgi:hypothetical protein
MGAADGGDQAIAPPLLTAGRVVGGLAPMRIGALSAGLIQSF